MKDRIPLPSAEFLKVLNLDLSPTALRATYPQRAQRHQYIAVITFFKHGARRESADKLSKFQGYFEAFDYLCILQDWERASTLLLSPLYNPDGEDLLAQLSYWGYHQQTIDYGEKLVDHLDPLNQLLLQDRMAGAHSDLGQYQQAIEACQASLKLCEKLGLGQTARDRLLNIGNIHLLNRNYVAASDAYNRSEQLATAIDSEYPDLLDCHRQQWKVGLLIGRGQALTMLGDRTNALDCLYQALTIARTTGMVAAEVTILGGLALLDQFWGDYDQAISYLEQAIELNNSLGNRPEQISILMNLAHTQVLRQNYAPAIDHYEQLLQFTDPELDAVSRANALNGCGNAYYSLAEYDQAYAHFMESWQISTDYNYQYGVAVASINIGEYWSSQGEPNLSISYLNAAQKVLLKLQDLTVHTKSYLYYQLAKSYHENNFHDLAHSYLDTAMEIAQVAQFPILSKCQQLATELDNTPATIRDTTLDPLSPAGFQQLFTALDYIDAEQSQQHLAEILAMLKILPTDPMHEVAGKAIMLRSIGYTSEALQGFQEFGWRFPTALPDTAMYVSTAVLFTQQLSALQVSGGVFIYLVQPGSFAESAGILAGDIITHYGKEPTVNATDVEHLIAMSPADLMVDVTFLRLHSQQHFVSQTVELPARLSGIQFAGI